MNKKIIIVSLTFFFIFLNIFNIYAVQYNGTPIEYYGIIEDARGLFGLTLIVTLILFCVINLTVNKNSLIYKFIFYVGLVGSTGVITVVSIIMAIMSFERLL